MRNGRDGEARGRRSDTGSGTDRSTPRRRLISGAGSGPALELLEVGTEQSGANAPLLCVHGAFGGAWMWAEAFLPALARLGRWGAAVSFRGHGGSEGRAILGSATLADYSADVLSAIDALAAPPIIIAHSLGALLAQRLLGTRSIRALVLLAPLPPEGMLLITPRLLFTAPRLWRAMLDALSNEHALALGQMRDAVFSGGFSPADIERYLSLMVSESHSVLLDCHLPLPVTPSFIARVPTLVVAGGKDRLVSPDAALRTALFHGAEHRVVEEGGHLVHLEPGAEELARQVVEWLEARGL